MKKFYNVCKANMYKNIHSLLGIIHLCFPITIIVCMVWYYSNRNYSDVFLIQYWQIISIGLTFAISIVVTLMFDIDQKAGGCQNILTLFMKKETGHLCNLITLMSMGFVAVLLAVDGFSIIMNIVSNAGISILLSTKAAIVIFITNIIVYIVQYLVCYNFGKGVSLGLGFVNVLISALFVIIGDGIWPFIPSSYGIRFIRYFSVEVFSEKINNVIVQNYNNGIVIASIISIIFIIIFKVWGNSWEGRNTSLD